MGFPPRGIINLDNTSSSSKGSVGSDEEEVLQWVCDLGSMKTFTMAFTIFFLHCRYVAPKLEEQQKLLKCFIDEPAEVENSPKPLHLQHQLLHDAQRWGRRQKWVADNGAGGRHNNQPPTGKAMEVGSRRVAG
jgi:hypothetical protein